MGSASAPRAPKPSKEYAKAVEYYLQFLPDLLQQEQDARNTYDPQRVDEQLLLQEQFGDRQTADRLHQLEQYDPQGVATRKALGEQVLGDLQKGYEIPADYQTELENQVRGAQAARGNILGNGAATQEAQVKGRAALDLYNQRLAHAGSFLAGTTPEQQLINVPGIQPDRTSQYVNMGAGFQGQSAGLGNYQNMLAAFQLSGGGSNPWASALGSVAGAAGSAAASYVANNASTYASALQAAGGAVGSASSDIRLKSNILRVGTAKSGVPVYEFNYRGDTRRFRGGMAHDIEKVFPDAVSLDGNGFARVNYFLTDVEFVEVEDTRSAPHH